MALSREGRATCSPPPPPPPQDCYTNVNIGVYIWGGDWMDNLQFLEEYYSTDMQTHVYIY